MAHALNNDDTPDRYLEEHMDVHALLAAKLQNYVQLQITDS